MTALCKTLQTFIFIETICKFFQFPVKITEWGTGTNEEDSDITMKQEIDMRQYGQTPLEVRDDGYFWFGGVRSNITLTFLSQVQ